MDKFSFFFQENNVFITVIALLSGIALFILHLPKKKIFISIPQAIDISNKQDVYWIDVRSYLLFRKGHIVHAKNIPLNEIKKRTSSIPSNRPLFLISSNGKDLKSDTMTLLNSLGYKKVFVIDGGMEDWIQNNLPIIKDD